jgi:hypothetical protein
MMWAALLVAGTGAVLGGLTAANCEGLAGVTTEKTWILVPHGRQVTVRGGPVVRSSTQLGPDDVHPLRLPPRTRIARSIVDACRWAPTDNHARLILASAIQQRLVRGAAIRATLGRLRAVQRSNVIRTTLADVEGGAHSLPELDFTALLRTFGLPEPDRQAVRRDSRNLPRWLDAYFEKWRLVVEIDGMWHMDASAWWADMDRQNELVVSGDRVLRFPSFAIRESQVEVARQIAAALHQGGWIPDREWPFPLWAPS